MESHALQEEQFSSNFGLRNARYCIQHTHPDLDWQKKLHKVNTKLGKIKLMNSYSTANHAAIRTKQGNKTQGRCLFTSST